MNDRLLNFINNSFLSSLLSNDNITDISFNGESLYYLDNECGRVKSDIKIKESEVKDFVRQIANLSEKQFSFQEPHLNISIANYRFYALHSSLCRYNYNKVTTFSLRKASYELKITDDSPFLTRPLVSLFKTLIDNHISIVIGGETSSGKTEFQKYLITKIERNSRVIVIDNILELDSLHQYTDLDLVIYENNEEFSFSNAKSLIKASLRNNPDWLIVSEARGEEMIDILTSAMSGHPIITTIHSLNALTIHDRMSMLILLNDKKINQENILKDLYIHFPIAVQIEKVINKDGKVTRRISQVVEKLSNGKNNVIYSFENNCHKYGKITKNLLLNLSIRGYNDQFNSVFVEGKYE
ncbi:MAG: ATPase, T2SS/T4P/T4SS family [Bacilli bacterium]